MSQWVPWALLNFVIPSQQAHCVPLNFGYAHKIAYYSVFRQKTDLNLPYTEQILASS